MSQKDLFIDRGINKNFNLPRSYTFSYNNDHLEFGNFEAHCTSQKPNQNVIQHNHDTSCSCFRQKLKFPSGSFHSEMESNFSPKLNLHRQNAKDIPAIYEETTKSRERVGNFYFNTSINSCEQNGSYESVNPQISRYDHQNCPICVINRNKGNHYNSPVKNASYKLETDNYSQDGMFNKTTSWKHLNKNRNYEYNNGSLHSVVSSCESAPNIIPTAPFFHQTITSSSVLLDEVSPTNFHDKVKDEVCNYGQNGDSSRFYLGRSATVDVLDGVCNYHDSEYEKSELDETHLYSNEDTIHNTSRRKSKSEPNLMIDMSNKESLNEYQKNKTKDETKMKSELFIRLQKPELFLSNVNYSKSQISEDDVHDWSGFDHLKVNKGQNLLLRNSPHSNNQSLGFDQYSSKKNNGSCTEDIPIGWEKYLMESNNIYNSTNMTATRKNENLSRSASCNSRVINKENAGDIGWNVSHDYVNRTSSSLGPSSLNIDDSASFVSVVDASTQTDIFYDKTTNTRVIHPSSSSQQTGIKNNTTCPCQCRKVSRIAPWLLLLIFYIGY